MTMLTFGDSISLFAGAIWIASWIWFLWAFLIHWPRAKFRKGLWTPVSYLSVFGMVTFLATLLFVLGKYLRQNP